MINKTGFKKKKKKVPLETFKGSCNVNEPHVHLAMVAILNHDDTKVNQF